MHIAIASGQPQVLFTTQQLAELTDNVNIIRCSWVAIPFISIKAA
jgi:hypothetical protein